MGQDDGLVARDPADPRKDAATLDAWCLYGHTVTGNVRSRE